MDFFSQRNFYSLGSEWNASNLEELTDNKVTYILNVAREIDNFFPGVLEYYNVREDDVEEADMLKYWHETSRFLSQVKNWDTEKVRGKWMKTSFGRERNKETLFKTADK